jgi:predicted enzyme related to lactoylglutathione lyase
MFASPLACRLALWIQTALIGETHRRPAMSARVGVRLIRQGTRIGASEREESTMFGETHAFSGFAVDDVERAQAFYGETLGIRTSIENGILTLHLAGERPTIVYPRSNHEPAGYTILNFPVTEIEQAVDELTARGVEIERYDGFEQDERGIMRGGGPYIAWFKDPAGNVLAVLQQR